MTKPNRQQWASVMADAAMNYGQVMNEAIVVYNTDTGQFDWQSSLTPLSDEQVMTENDVRWDNYWVEGEPNQQDLYNYFANDNDASWEEALERIDSAGDEDNQPRSRLPPGLRFGGRPQLAGRA